MFSRPSDISQSMIIDDIKSMLRYGRKAFAITVLILSFLLFFLNILIGIGNNMSRFSNQLKSTLSFKFFVLDDTEKEDLITDKVLFLQRKLDEQWISSLYVSKQDARNYMTKQIPDIIWKFDEYRINNPFPAMLEVKIVDENDYKTLQTIVPEFADIITNPDEVWKWVSIAEQESTTIKALTFSNFLVTWSYFLIVIFIVILLTILYFLLRILTNKFHEKIELKKLLWASYNQIALPFIWISLAVFIVGFICMLLLNVWLDMYLQSKDFSLIFFVDVFSLDIVPQNIGAYLTAARYVLVIEFIVLSLLIVFSNGIFLQRVIRKAWN